MRISIFLLVVPVLLVGCESANKSSWTGAATGATAGAVAGGVIGHQSGKKWQGALIGGAAGGATGWFVGSELGESTDRATKSTPEYREAESYFDQANRTEDPGEAIELYDKAIALEPGLPEPHNNKGLQYLKIGDESGARRSFEEALRVDPDYRPAAENLERLLAS